MCLAWVGFVDRERGTIQPHTWRGDASGYVDGLVITVHDGDTARGPTGTALRTGVTQVNQDFLTNPKAAPWRAEAMKRGYRSSISLPLKDGDRTFAVLTLYASEPDAFDDDEVTLLSKLAADLAYAALASRTRNAA